jgi:hypothetical protein
MFTSASISTVTIGLAGCLQENDPQVRVYNARDNQATVKIVLYDTEPKQRVFTDRKTVPPSEAHEYESMYDEGGLKRLVVRTEDGHENRHEIDVLPKSEWGGGRGYLSVHIEEDRIEFDQALG